MKQTAQDNTLWWDRALGWLTNTTPKSHRYPQTIILQLILLWAIIACIGYAVLFVITLRTTPINTLWTLLIFTILYAISRTRLYNIASLTLIIFLIAQPYLRDYVTIYDAHPLFPIFFSIFAVPMSMILFTNRMRWIIMVWVVILEVVTLGIFGLMGFLPIQVSLSLSIISMAIPVIYHVVSTAYSANNTASDNGPSQHLVNTSPDIIALVIQGNIAYVNPAGKTLLLLNSESDVIGKPLDSIIIKAKYDPTDSNKYVTRSGMSGDMVVESIETIERNDGTTFRAWVTMKPFDLDGIMATSVSIKPLPSFIHQPESILDSADALITVQQNGKMIYINGHFERLTGYGRQEVYSADYNRLQYTHEEDRERVAQWLQNVLDGEGQGQSIEYRMYHKKQSIIWVRTTGTIIRYSGKPTLLTTTVEIKPKQAEAMSLLALEHMPSPWLLVKVENDEPVIMGFHQGSREWFEEDTILAGMKLADIIVGLPRSISSILELTTQQQKPYQQRNQIKVSNDKIIPIEWTAIAIEDDVLADYLIVLRETANELMLEDELLRYRAMFDMMNDYAFLLKVQPDQTYEFVWVNNAFEMITGYNPHSERANEIIKRLPFVDDIAIVESHYDQLLAGEMSVVEYRIVTQSGVIRWLREHAYPVVEDDRTILIYGSVSDISDFVKSEEALKSIALQQAVIAEIGMVAANATLDIPSFANQILNLVTQLITVSWCVLIEHQVEDNKFYVHSIVGEPYEGKVESTPGDKTSYLGYVLDQNDPVVVRDWSSDTRFSPPKAYKELGIQSSLSVVVPMQDRAFGILNVHDIEPRIFSGEHINLLQTIANLVGTYIQQRQTQDAEREHRMMAEALINIATVLNSTTALEDILRLILGFVSQIVPVVDSANLMMVDLEKQTATITIRHTVNPDVPNVSPGLEIAFEDIPLLVQIVESGETLVLNDVTTAKGWFVVPETSWVKSYLGAPIFAGDECIGVLSLDSAQVNAFTSAHLQQMQAFLNQASIAIQNARHAEQLASEIKNATEELQSEQARLQAILDATGEGIFYSRDFKMLYTNTALANMMGYSQAEILGKSSHIFRPDHMTEEDMTIRNNIQKSLRASGISRAELQFQRKDGSTFMGGVTASRISYQDGVLEAVTVVRDISREKEIDAQKEIFISNAAHELRGPITTLNTRMYIMKNKETIARADVEKMDVVVQKMNALVSGLLDMSRFERGHIQLNLQSIILQNILDEVMDFQLPEAKKKWQTLQAIAPEEPMNIVADSLRFNQVLTNLVSNSISYTQEGGQIDVIVGYTDNTQQKIKIEVVDNGIGIDKDSLKSIFTPFSQAHNNTFNKGTGLGLSISKQIVEAHGGRIEVESIESVGSRFIVYLPTSAKSSDE